MKPHEIFAIVDKKPDGERNIVGLFHPEFGHLPCVNSKRGVVEQMWEKVDPITRLHSKIIRFVEVEE